MLKLLRFNIYVYFMNKIQNTSKYLNTLCKIVKTYKKKTFYNIEYKLE